MKKITQVDKMKGNKTKECGMKNKRPSKFHKNFSNGKKSGSVDETSSSVVEKKPPKKFKKKSKMKPRKVDKEKENRTEEKSTPVLSANWQAFLKEISVEKKESKHTSKSTKGHQRNRKRKKSENNYQNKIQPKKAKENETINKEDIWFDDVEIEDIEHATGMKVVDTRNKVEKEPAFTKTEATTYGQIPRITKRLAIDCEMVGTGIDGKDSILARVSIVNSFGETVYDTFVAPMQEVVDYRTEFSGVRPENLVDAPTFEQVQKVVANITNGKILIGHAIYNDLKVLLLSHPRKSIRDTSSYKPFKKLLATPHPSLKRLTKEILNVDIQSGEHSSVEDARCTMKIYQLYKNQWEKSIKDKGYKKIIGRTPSIFMGKDSRKDKKKYLKRKIERRRLKKEKKESINNDS